MARYYFLLGDNILVKDYFKNPFPKEEQYKLDRDKFDKLTMDQLFDKNITGDLSEKYLKNFNSYFINQILNKISCNDNSCNDKNFEYASFWNFTYSWRTPNNTGYSYNFRSINPMNHSSNWNNNSGINNIVITQGRMPKEVKKGTNTVEILVNDNFALHNNATIGQEFTINFENRDLESLGESTDLDKITFKVVGYGYKYANLTPSNFSGLTTSIDNHGEFFVDNSFFINKINGLRNDKFRQTKQAPKFWEERYIKNFADSNVNAPFTNQINGDIKLFSQGTSAFKGYSSHSGIKSLINLYIITWIYIAIGIILFILSFIFIIFVLKKEINSTRRQLGVFKSLGYKSSELTWIFALKTFLSMLLGITIGYFMSFPFQIQAATVQYKGMVVFGFDSIYSHPVFLTILIGLIPLAFMGLSYLIILKFLSESALNLLSFGPKQKEPKIIIWTIRIIFFPILLVYLINKLILLIMRKRGTGFTYRMQNAFISSSRGKFYIIISLFAFTSFLLTLQLRAVPVINTMLNGAFNIGHTNLNHFLTLNDIDPLVMRDELEINKDRDYEINYLNIADTDYDSVYEYVINEMAYTKEIEVIMNSLVKAKKNILDDKDNNLSELALSIALNTIALYYPLNYADNLRLLNSSNLNYHLTIAKQNEEKPIKVSLMNIKPVEHYRGKSRNTAIALNDIGKYMCISTPFQSDCSNIDQFREKVLSLIFDNNMQMRIDLSKVKLNNKMMQLAYQFFQTASGVNPILSANSIIFDGTQESFYLKQPYFISGGTSANIDDALVYAFDTTGKNGDFTKNFNFDHYSLDRLNSILYKEKIEYKNRDKEIYPAIISFRLSKLLNVEKNDIFTINLGLKGEIRKIKIVDINYNDTLLENIYMDYWTYIQMIGSNELIEEIRNQKINSETKYFFNVLLSNKKSNEGRIDWKDIPGSLRSFRSYKDSIAMASKMSKQVEEPSAWLNSWLDIYLTIIRDQISNDKLTNLELKQYLSNNFEQNNEIPSREKIIKKIDELLQSPKQSYFIAPESIISMPILKLFADEMMKEFTKSMWLYMGINIILVTILLIVIMNIIINDSKNIIAVMRSLGYSNKKINWIIIGKYVTGALLTFIFAFIFSLILWYAVQTIVWSEFKVLIMIPIAIWIPFAAGAILGFIVLLGWLAASAQIKKLPLTYLVS